MHSWVLDGDTIRWSEGGLRGTIRLVPLEDRRLGSVVVPRHRVDIAFEEFSEAEGEAFLVRFHRAFLRGGGSNRPIPTGKKGGLPLAPSDPESAMRYRNDLMFEYQRLESLLHVPNVYVVQFYDSR